MNRAGGTGGGMARRFGPLLVELFHSSSKDIKKTISYISRQYSKFSPVTVFFHLKVITAQIYKYIDISSAMEYEKEETFRKITKSTGEELIVPISRREVKKSEFEKTLKYLQEDSIIDLRVAKEFLEKEVTNKKYAPIGDAYHTSAKFSEFYDDLLLWGIKEEILQLSGMKDPGILLDLKKKKQFSKKKINS